MGYSIEPYYTLGYDWKIGIALVTSFAAREVFVRQWQRCTVLVGI
jgi:Fe2+ transport system protein B